MDSSLITIIITSLSTAVVTSPLSIWLFKRWLKNKDARELARYKTQLAIEQDQRQAQFVALHSQRTEIMNKLSGDCWDFRIFLIKLNAAVWGAHPKSYKMEVAESAQPKVNEIFIYYAKNRIHFTEEVCDKIEALINFYRGLIDRCMLFAYDDNRRPTQEEFEGFWLTLHREAMQAYLDLQNEFRRMNGIAVAA